MKETQPGALLAPPELQRLNALFLDFDGTLVEIAPSPAQVQVPAELCALLSAVAARLDGAVAIVSGRSIEDLARHLASFPGVFVGQHGLERRRADGRVIQWSATPAFAKIRARLTEFAARHEGVMIEDKGATIAVHFRGAPWLAARCRDFVRRAIGASGGAFEAIDGKMVVELVPEGSGKGGAVAALVAEPPFAGRVPVFIGDDSVDEEGFSVIDRLGGVSIHVGPGPSVARHRLASVAEVRAWLARGAAA